MERTPSISNVFSKVQINRERDVCPSTPQKKLKRLCYFNKDWLQEEKYANWLKQTPGDPHSATCTLCVSHISVKFEG